MWVEITNGPSWSLGLCAEYSEEDNILLFHEIKNGEPWWYSATEFRFVAINKPLKNLVQDLGRKPRTEAESFALETSEWKTSSS